MDNILMEVHYIVKEGKREEFLLKIMSAGIDDASRNEMGNDRYEFFYPVAQEDQLVLIEEWKTVEDQKKHAETKHYQALSELKKIYVLDTQIKRLK